MSKKFSKDSLGLRMKTYYEDRTRYLLPRRTYTIIRIDGRSHSNYTRGLERPYSVPYMDAIDITAKYLCLNIPGVKLAYTQSDEISLVITDFDKQDTQAFFDGNIQKIVSVTASMAAAFFNQPEIAPNPDKLASFDARVFTIPSEIEVFNSIHWRQLDATRNSISMLAQAHYSHKELHRKKRDDMHQMLYEKGINWNNEPTRFKRGGCVIKTDDGWKIDDDIPIFNHNRAYILDRLPKQ